MLAIAIEAEISAFIAQRCALKTDDHQAVMARNGYLPERSIQTGLCDIEVPVSKARNHSCSGIKFHSGLVAVFEMHPEHGDISALAVLAKHFNG